MRKSKRWHDKIARWWVDETYLSLDSENLEAILGYSRYSWTLEVKKDKNGKVIPLLFVNKEDSYEIDADNVVVVGELENAWPGFRFEIMNKEEFEKREKQIEKTSSLCEIVKMPEVHEDGNLIKTLDTPSCSCHGGDVDQDVVTMSEKINEIVEWINSQENNESTPSTI